MLDNRSVHKGSGTILPRPIRPPTGYPQESAFKDVRPQWDRCDSVEIDPAVVFFAAIY
jgi:hypothetical protein